MTIIPVADDYDVTREVGQRLTEEARARLQELRDRIDRDEE